MALLIKGALVIYTGKNLTDISLEKYYTTSFISFLSSAVGQLHLVLWVLFMHVATLKMKTGMRHACQSYELSVQCQFGSSGVNNNNYAIFYSLRINAVKSILTVMADFEPIVY